ncbi:MAG: tRNA (adenosine(37)-N6)-threonylcarbamoyltransferase complex dimerization subunit type 1 TsaB [Vreelandella alkaliphila]|uniref:tRNA threonylcarbamoyladenosine biosynthesis protein TsaB n=1 Tax=Halomonas campaniensis TaxID=213554 RepID=A0A3D0KCN9_9GAMM|nr:MULTISPECIES: tRNA (adenosine(37)-N6)-threonylcarbamoyltransferase complex dimerization subunit type 1 TsaB [unclassified Halomonas]HBP40850.1 tRNA (adenosine(37)-N6)-threonylcarbamoyltransferase complex dimerization subunit type 1 TsaB [Halomonas sp.]HBS81978.1 tRNA (adenosine(37)-N6)-threonylcarbamoyltransferase complex dimerization subunit type 1 TsaB [Halomonas campaniensis]HCA01307.1 tRNA (adenosine(37)-N6)-threonylcarbamoyltransferase complex dimerization subunit type 1 TsaB [Halomonas 
MSSLYLLALDASSSACSAALLRQQGSQRECLARFEMTPRAHTRRLMPMVDDILAEANISTQQLDAVAFGRGPGSFTGLRIAAGAAQGLAFGLDRPLLGISTLEALALQAHRRYHFRHVVTALDARMGEIYAATWHCLNDTLSLQSDEVVVAPANFCLPAEETDWVGVGSGFTLWDDFALSLQANMSQHLTDLEPRAEEMAWLAARDLEAGLGQAANEAQPVYLRNDVAWKKPA